MLAMDHSATVAAESSRLKHPPIKASRLSPAVMVGDRRFRVVLSPASVR